MKESLHFKGDEYNTLLSMFTAGYVIGYVAARLSTSTSFTFVQSVPRHLAYGESLAVHLASVLYVLCYYPRFSPNTPVYIQAKSSGQSSSCAVQPRRTCKPCTLSVSSLVLQRYALPLFRCSSKSIFLRQAHTLECFGSSVAGTAPASLANGPLSVCVNSSDVSTSAEFCIVQATSSAGTMVSLSSRSLLPSYLIGFAWPLV